MLNDIHATLAISKEEARQGTSRALTLPGGRQVSVAIPSGTSDGQIIRLDAQTGSLAQAGAAELLVLTIAVTAPPVPVADPEADAATIHADIGLGRRNATNAPIASQTQLTLKSEQPLANGVNHAGMLPSPASYQTLSATPAPRNPRSSTTTLVLLIALVLLLIGGSVSAFYYFSNSRDNGTAGGPAATATALAQGLTATSSGQNNDAATSTAIAQVNVNSTATTQANQANAYATLQANATATAQVNVTATAQVVATATALAQQNPYGGTLAFSDPMSDNSGGHNWAEISGCQFSGGAYHVTAAANYNNVCHGQNTNYSNFAMQAQLTFISSGQHFSGLGFVFRSDGNYNEYELTIFERGTYSITLCKYTNPGANCGQALAQGTCPNWNAGLNNPNTVAIVANGGDISLYINGKRIAHGSDTTYTQGQIGFLSTGGDATTEGAISNLKVWTL